MNIVAQALTVDRARAEARVARYQLNDAMESYEWERALQLVRTLEIRLRALEVVEREFGLRLEERETANG